VNGEAPQTNLLTIRDVVAGGEAHEFLEQRGRKRGMHEVTCRRRHSANNCLPGK
jgi:hypothetical protein